MELNPCPPEPQGPAGGQLSHREGTVPRTDSSLCPRESGHAGGYQRKRSSQLGAMKLQKSWLMPESKKTNVVPLKLLAYLSIISFLFLCPAPQFLWATHCLPLHRKSIWCLYYFLSPSHTTFMACYI